MATYLNLHLWIPQKDVRKLIYKMLNSVDRAVVRVAHNSKLGEKQSFWIFLSNATMDVSRILKWGQLNYPKLLTANPFERESVELHKIMCRAAAKYGNVSTLRYLIDGDVDEDEQVMRKRIKRSVKASGDSIRTRKNSHVRSKYV
jgi:hypothetical protein